MTFFAETSGRTRACSLSRRVSVTGQPRTSAQSVDEQTASETPRSLERERRRVTDANDERVDPERDADERREDRECEVCGERVPAAVYREHLLKACPGR